MAVRAAAAAYTVLLSQAEQIIQVWRGLVDSANTYHRLEEAATNTVNPFD